MPAGIPLQYAPEVDFTLQVTWRTLLPKSCCERELL